MIASDQFSQSIRASGHRLTKQRQLVMEVLAESQEHLDADALHDRVRARQPNVGLATVYRTLTLLKEMGLVSEHSLGEEHNHFEAVQKKPHYHFTCLKCGTVIELESTAVLRAVRSLSDQAEIQVTEVQLFLTGYCAECRQEGG